MSPIERVRCARGQASVELIAALPVIAVAIATAWQLLVAGHAFWSTAEAARAGAREYAVRRNESGRQAARRRATAVAARVLPAGMRRAARVSFSGDDRISLRVRVPLVFPFSGVFRYGPAITSRSAFGA